MLGFCLVLFQSGSNVNENSKKTLFDLFNRKTSQITYTDPVKNQLKFEKENILQMYSYVAGKCLWGS